MGTPAKDHFRLPLWAYVAAALIVVGSLGSFVGARAVASAADARGQRAFLSDTQAIGATLEISIQHEQDLIVNTESFFIGDDHASEAQFLVWAKSVHVLRRFSDVNELGIIQYVALADLPAYTRMRSGQQGSPFHVVPPGRRPFYCLASIGLQRKGVSTIGTDVDLCDSVEGPVLLHARDSGASSVLPYDYHGERDIALETPFYRGGSIPRTTAAREAQFSYFIGVLLVPHILLTTALDGHAGTAVALHYGAATSALVYRSGRPPAGARDAQVNLHDGWTLVTSGDGGRHGLFASSTATLLLFGGVIVTIMLSALIFLLATGRARSMLLVRDRTAQLEFQALHDSLTGLPNRALILDRVDQLLERNRRTGVLGAVLFVDLDDFKNVNDSLGHEAGDHLLTLVAWRMKNALRGADTIGRMGGDEFIVLIDGGADEVAPEVVAQRLLDLMRQPFILKGSTLPVYVNTSIGIAVGDRTNASDLLRDADVALYEAKGAGKNRFASFNSTMASETDRRVVLEFDLRSALSDGEFHLVYQPIYRLADLSVVGFEALLRWRHPTEGVIEPIEFIPILERTGKINEVGASVLREACAQLWTWRSQGYDVTMSVNVSSRQFESDLIVDQIRDATRSKGFEGNLIIEITETALMHDVEATIRRLGVVKDMGVRVAIDDFGTGYCSMSYLRLLPIDFIKIDGSFIADVATSPESAALVRTFIQLSQDLGLTSIAEGVETIEQLDTLRGTAVDKVQGFLLSRPLLPDALDAQIFPSMHRGAPRR
jgi:diguanylate cyclase (GGDEF)-like protein